MIARSQRVKSLPMTHDPMGALCLNLKTRLICTLTALESMEKAHADYKIRTSFLAYLDR